MIDKKKIRLVFFLSRATPLQKWVEVGTFSREVAIYQKLRPLVDHIAIVSSGGEEELALQAQLGDIEILYNRWGLSPNLYSLFAPWYHRNRLREATVFKTNQLDGSWTAILAGKLFGKKVVVRAGYLWAKNVVREELMVRASISWKSRLIQSIERKVLRSADQINLTTIEMKKFVEGEYQVNEKRVMVVPNYVDTDHFSPNSVAKVAGRILFVGRLNRVKNLDLLIQALAGLDQVQLQLIGEGEEKEALASLAAELAVSVQFLGRVPNEQLPDYIRQAEIFCLLSQFEGHPKALIEAMSCGAAVIGTDVDGIREMIEDGVSGVLCPATVAGIREGIEKLINDMPLRTRLGQEARAFVEANYSLSGVVEKELAILQRLSDEFVQ